MLNSSFKKEPILLSGPSSSGGIGNSSGKSAEATAEPIAGSCEAGEVFRVGGGVTSPELTYKVDPEYTEEARNAKKEGTVVLSLIVQCDGSVRDIRVTQPLGVGLDERAVGAVKQWRFRPGMRGGAPVNVAVIVEVTFKLR